MAVKLPHGLDGYLPLLSTADIKMKLNVGGKLFTYLEEPNNSIECSDIGEFLGNMVQWLSNSNPKVTEYGIDIITHLISRMKTDFKPYISDVIPPVVDRLGDSKELIKLKALFLIMKLMENDIISPQVLFDKISVSAFNHKNSNVKEGSMKLLLTTIEEFGANCIVISKIVPMIVKLLSDSSVQVRQKAVETLVDLYKHVGEKLRFDLQKNYSIPQSKMTDLMNKFDEAKAVGGLLPTAVDEFNLTNNENTSRTHVLTPTFIHTSFKNSDSRFALNPSKLSQKFNTSASNSSHTGAVDEDTFIQSFEDVPTLNVFSVRDLDAAMKQLHETIQDSNEQWIKRIDALKKIRSLVLIGSMKHVEFFNNLRYLERSFQTSVKDLRSQVVRETCITIAFLSQRLGAKFNNFAESVLNSLIDLIPNSTKVIASSGLIAIRFILKFSHNPRIIPILANTLGSKSKDIRRACCEFFDQILNVWPTNALDRHITLLQDSIKKGIADADSDARLLSRKAFWKFCEHFPEQGDILLNKLEPSYRKILLTNSGSKMCFLNSQIDEGLTLNSRQSISSQNNTSVRSCSAIDLRAAHSAKLRTQCSAFTRQKVNPLKTSQSIQNKMNKENIHKKNTEKRNNIQIAASQPTSDSGSPPPKLLGQLKSRIHGSSIPRSQITSKKASPKRCHSLGSYSICRQPLISLTSKPLLKTFHQNTLLLGQEADTNLTNAVSNHKSSRKIMMSLNERSDESCISSICSDRSINSRKKQSSDSYCWNVSQNPLNEVIEEATCLDIEDIVLTCESSCWNNRKEGLINLQRYLQQGKIINKILLERLTNVFTKMFMDSETKVFGLFLQVLNELITTHSQFLEYWLCILLVKLFNKGGSDILESVRSQIFKTMDIVRSSFPCDLQLTAVLKFLTDHTQTPNIYMKILAMNYILKLVAISDSRLIFSSAVDGNRDYVALALEKMIGWTVDNNKKQGPELKRATQKTIIALYSINASQITLRLSQLPENYQEIFFGLIKFRLRRSSVDRLLSPKNHSSPTSSLASPPLQPDTIKAFNSKKRCKSLKHTTPEILKYNFHSHTENSDSDINKMVVPTKAYDHDFNGFINNFNVGDGIIKILHDLDKDNLQLVYKQPIFNHLKELIRDGPSDMFINHYKKIIKVIFKLLMDVEPIIREEALFLLMYLVQQPEMVSCFHNFTELIINKILYMSRDPCKMVAKFAEECLFALSVSFPPEATVRFVTPMIFEKQFPVNLLAIKMITKIVDTYGTPPVAVLINEIISGLLHSCNDPDSAVRKSAVYCIALLYVAFGEQVFTPYISSLNGAKLKLLYFYIERCQQLIVKPIQTNS